MILFSFDNQVLLQFFIAKHKTFFIVPLVEVSNKNEKFSVEIYREMVYRGRGVHEKPLGFL